MDALTLHGKSWNTVIRTLLHLPYNTHTCYLGPLKLSVVRLSVDTLDQNQHVIICNLLTLLNVRSGHDVIDNLNHDQVDILINYLSTT